VRVAARTVPTQVPARLFGLAVALSAAGCPAVLSDFHVGDAGSGQDGGVGDATPDTATRDEEGTDSFSPEDSGSDAFTNGGEAEAGSSESGSALDAAQDTSAPDALHDAPIEAPTCTCVDDLSNVGLGDFYIAFTITLNVTTPVAIANQRPTCETTLPYWSVHTGSANGLVYMEIGAGNNVYEEATNTQSIVDGQSHRIVIARTSGGTTVTFTVDGTTENTATVNVEALTGTLAGLEIGVDNACTGNGSIAGQPSNFCLSIGCPIQ